MATVRNCDGAMAMDNWIVMLLLGLGAGVLSGMFGIGGGVVIVPMLVLLGFELQTAVGTSLAALLAPVGIFAVISYYRAGKLKIGVALWVALGLELGATLAAQIAIGLDRMVLQHAYAIFLLYAGWRFSEPRVWFAEWRAAVPPPPEPDHEPMNTHWYVMLAIGFGAGILSGLFGVGGGIVIVPILVGLLHFDQKLASGTSLAALLLPVGLGAVLTYYNDSHLDVTAAILIAIGLTTGALSGARLALGMQSRMVKRLYGVFVLCIAVYFLIR